MAGAQHSVRAFLYCAKGVPEITVRLRLCMCDLIQSLASSDVLLTKRACKFLDPSLRTLWELL